MDFIDQVKLLGNRIGQLKDDIKNEEATKTSMIMPFFQMLGYDIFNPKEFVPEYTADVGIKKGEKVDYAILNDTGEPLILVEAKWCGENLDGHADQLYRYFTVTSAKFGILTNGIEYRFYTDLEEPNKMDEKPFLEINFLDIKESLIPELKKFQKTSFDLDTIFTAASELKYNSQIKQFLAKELANPSDEFVSFIISNIYPGRKTQKIIEDFHDIVKKSFVQFINEQLNDRLQSALGGDPSTKVPLEEDKSKSSEEIITDTVKPKIVTTEEEIEAFFIIKTLLHDNIADHTINYKDTESYFGILLDNNTRKWICHLQLGEKKKSLLLPCEGKAYTRYQIDSLDDIYNHKDELIQSVKQYIV